MQNNVELFFITMILRHDGFGKLAAEYSKGGDESVVPYVRRSRCYCPAPPSIKEFVHRHRYLGEYV